MALGVCAINGLLYVIGGDDGSCNLSSVEFYNPATDKWSLIPTNMSNGRSYAGKGRGYTGKRRGYAGKGRGYAGKGRSYVGKRGAELRG